MKYNKLGQTDITVSAVAMGCWAIADPDSWGAQDEETSIATIRTALDAGITFFDTAEAYGNGYSEQLLAKALAGRRHEAVIASKVSTSNLTKEKVLEACERSLKNLNTDYIDLYQTHWASREVPFDETYEALQKLQTEGKIRAIGVCNFGPKDLSECVKTGRCETNQVPYSLLWRAIEYDITELCMENEIGILPYSPLVQGLLTGKFKSADEVPEGRARTRYFSKDRPLVRHGENGCEEELFEAIKRIRQICKDAGHPMSQVALAWLLHQSSVTSVLAGARSPDQARMNAEAANLKLAPELLEEVDQASLAVKQKIGDNPDMWQSESRFR